MGLTHRQRFIQASFKNLNFRDESELRIEHD
jgi:hypothetical protein